MDQEIVVQDGADRSNSAIITLDAGVSSLDDFKLLCSTALGQKVEQVFDLAGVRLTDVRQLRRRQRCVVCARGEPFRPAAPPLVRIVLAVLGVGVGALLWTLLRVRSPPVHAECPPDGMDSVALSSMLPPSQPVHDRAPRPPEEECATTAAAVEQPPSDVTTTATTTVPTEPAAPMRMDAAADSWDSLAASAASGKAEQAAVTETAPLPQRSGAMDALSASSAEPTMAADGVVDDGGATASGLRVLVERRRQTWSSDHLFSWAVVGSAMQQLGLNEALPMLTDGVNRTDWDVLLCLTEECSGVDLWQWPDSFTKLASTQLFNHFPGITELSGRERLFRNLASMAERFGSEFEVMPDTYLLPEDAPAFHAALRESSGRASGRADLWILKNLSVPLGPQLAFGAGKQIIAADAPPAHLPTTGQFLTQRYVAEPYLLHGRKFTLRFYLLLTSVAPVRLYMFEEGLAHVAVDKYSTATPDALANPYAHVTNEALAARHDETMPAATGGGNTAAVSAGGARRAAAAEVRKHRCVLTLREVRSALLKAGKDVDAIWRQIEAIAIKAVLSAEERLVFYSDSLLNRGGRVFELLAMDVVLDRQTRPWLLKLTDTVPSLQAETNLKYAMKERMVMDMLRMVGAARGGDETDVDEARFQRRLQAMVARWGAVSSDGVQLLRTLESELANRGGWAPLQPSQRPGSAGDVLKAYFRRPTDLLVQRWLAMAE